MKNNRMLNHSIRIAIAAVLVLAVLAAALPQRAQAASCMVYYKVKDGDKTGTIARKYDLKWIEIAAANGLERPYELEAGQTLCIPFQYSVSLKDNITVKSVNDLIKVTAEDFQKGGYYVKVRDVTTVAGKWYQLGRMNINRDIKIGNYSLPKELRSAIYLQVCLKNGTTDKVVCRTTRHTFR